MKEDQRCFCTNCNRMFLYKDAKKLDWCGQRLYPFCSGSDVDHHFKIEAKSDARCNNCE